MSYSYYYFYFCPVVFPDWLRDAGYHGNNASGISGCSWNYISGAGKQEEGKIKHQGDNNQEINPTQLNAAHVFCFLFPDGVSDSGPSVHQQVNALRDPHADDSGLGWCLWYHACSLYLPRGEELDVLVV